MARVSGFKVQFILLADCNCWFNQWPFLPFAFVRSVYSTSLTIYFSYFRFYSQQTLFAFLQEIKCPQGFYQMSLRYKYSTVCPSDDGIQSVFIELMFPLSNAERRYCINVHLSAASSGIITRARITE